MFENHFCCAPGVAAAIHLAMSSALGWPAAALVSLACASCGHAASAPSAALAAATHNTTPIFIASLLLREVGDRRASRRPAEPGVYQAPRGAPDGPRDRPAARTEAAPRPRSLPRRGRRARPRALEGQRGVGLLLEGPRQAD